MGLRITKIITAILFTAFLFSCGKKAAETDHSCCNKSNNAINITTEQAVHSVNNSIYQLTGSWTNQQNEQIQLDRLRGKIRLVAMIFTHCGYACPKMVDNMKEIQKALPENLKDKVGYVLISFDPERDHPGRLKQYAGQKHLDARWTLLHGTKSQVRILSMLLQLQYSQLPDGNFNHSNILTLLDEEGAIVRQFKGLDLYSGEVLQTIKQLAEK